MQQMGWVSAENGRDHPERPMPSFAARVALVLCATILVVGYISEYNVDLRMQQFQDRVELLEARLADRLNQLNAAFVREYAPEIASRIRRVINEHLEDLTCDNEAERAVATGTFQFTINDYQVDARMLVGHVARQFAPDSNPRVDVALETSWVDDNGHTVVKTRYSATTTCNTTDNFVGKRVIIAMK
jgi:hypothetical protein